MRFTKEEFKRAIAALEIMSRDERDIGEALTAGPEWIGSSWVQEYYGLIEQMCDISSDYDNDLSYFVYDLDFGRNWHPGMVTDENGEDVPLSTIDNLWDLLTRED